MRAHLLDSLRHLADAVGDAAPPEFQALIDALSRGGIASPSGFGLYYEATRALLEHDHDAGLALLGELAGEPLLRDRALAILPLGRVVPQARRERYQRLMDTDPDTPFSIVPPAADEGTRGVEAFASALERLRALVPALAGEFDALIREVVLVTGDPALGYDFAGGSCYMLWGALFINAGRHKTDVEMIEAIAHESGHSLLFGFTIDEPLVLNDERELYASPLRDDPRPMDGIYHATYVSARMHWTLSRLLESGALSAQESEEAEARRQASARGFWSGHETVLASAQLSDTGRRLLEGARAWMTAFPAIR